MDPYLTVYQRDYPKKTIIPTPLNPAKQEFEDPVGEGFRRYLVLTADAQSPNENLDQYLSKFKDNYKKLGARYFHQSLDQDTILLNDISDKATEYQVKYCDLLKDMEYAKELTSKKLILPDDIEIPVTTQKSAFRNPRQVCPGLLKPPAPILPRNHLRTSEKLRTNKAGVSNYMDSIGKLGHFIVTEQLHGKITHPPCTCALHHPEK